MRWDAYRNMGVSSVPLRVSGWEDSVDKNKGTNYLCPQSSSLVVPKCQLIGSTSVLSVEWLLERLHQPNTADCSQALCYHVQHCSDQRHLPRQEQPECHRRVYVSSCIPKFSYLSVITEISLSSNNQNTPLPRVKKKKNFNVCEKIIRFFFLHAWYFLFLHEFNY